MINLDDIENTIRITLYDIELWSHEAEQLLLGTGAVESRFSAIRQYKGGPARSFFQIEPATCKDNLENYLAYRSSLWRRIYKKCYVPKELVDEKDLTKLGWILQTNIAFSICMARIKYRRVPKALPKLNDIDGQAKYWLKYYNAGGKGTIEKYKKAYKLINKD